MRFEQLTYLVEISKHKSMSVASEHLHLSPQGLSMSMKTLENELGIVLLKRDSQGVSLTEGGRKLVVLAESFFNGLNGLQKEFRIESAVHNINRDINLIFSETMLDGVLTQILTDIYKTFPELKVELNPLKHEEIIDKIINNEIPYAFYYRCFINDCDIINDIPKNSVVFKPIFKSEIFCCVNHSNPLATQSKISLNDLSTETIILMKSFEHISNKILFSVQLKPKTIFAPSLKSLNELLHNNMGVAFSGLPHSSSNNHVFSSNVNRYSIYNNDSCLNIPFEETIIYEFGYIYRKGSILDSSYQNIINYITTKLQDM